MHKQLTLHPDRLFPADTEKRTIARRLYGEVAALPIISPHGHTDPEWWATDAPFGNAAELLLHPDHYVFRMLYSQGVSFEALGIGNPDADPRESWRLFASRYRLFRGTPSRMWLDWVFAESFGIEVLLSGQGNTFSGNAMYSSGAVKTTGSGRNAITGNVLEAAVGIRFGEIEFQCTAKQRRQIILEVLELVRRFSVSGLRRCLSN